MTERAPPRGMDAPYVYEKPFKPIDSEQAAQSHGDNIHSLAAARDRRERVIWSLDGPDAAA